MCGIFAFFYNWSRFLCVLVVIAEVLVVSGCGFGGRMASVLGCQSGCLCFLYCFVGVRGVLVVVFGLKCEECEKALLAWLKNAVCGRFGGANLARVAFGCGFDKLCFKIILKNALKSLCEIW